jgi:hypothetical protein
MNRYLFPLIALLAVGVTVSYLYQHHGLAAIRTHLPGAHPAVTQMALSAQCGCTVDTDEHFPTTPQEIKQVKIKEKREEAEGEYRNKQIALRLHRLVHVGMARTQVEKVMGDTLGGGETPPDSFKGHSAVDSDDYGDYEVAFSAKDTVVWVRPL